MTDAPPIKGYRPLEPEMIEMVNQNKLIEELALRQVDRHVRVTSETFDQRLVALARTHLQIGFMLLNRSVTQPERINGPIDVESLVVKLAKTE